jgi:hypothetical protein
MSQDKISALLGRPLSATETTNFSTYLSLAQGRVSDILCANICPQYEEAKTFELRDGYRTLNLPIFTEIQSITIDGSTLDPSNYSVRQGLSFNGEWFNAVVFNNAYICTQVVVTADWGFNQIPNDVQLMVAEQFGLMSDSLDADNVTRKQVEDFSVQFNGTKTDSFNAKYAPTINKYSCCVKGNVQSGNIYRGGYDYGRIFPL